MYLWVERRLRLQLPFLVSGFDSAPAEVQQSLGRALQAIQVPDMSEKVVLLPTLSGFSGSMMNRP